MKIVTGYTGTPHISSNDDQARNQGIFGTGNYILDVGQKFNATLTNATTVTLEDGEGMMQGVHFRIEPGMTEAVSISPGTTGYNRIDLICARYTKDASTGVEDVSLVVIEGTPTTSTPSVPTYTEGDILAGDTLAYFPMFKVTINGLTPSIARYAPNYSIGHNELLWSGNLSDSNITVDLTPFSAVEIWFGNTITPPAYLVVQKFCKGSVRVNEFYGDMMYFREMTVSDSGIVVGTCKRYDFSTQELTDSDGTLVPIKVYGIA